MRCNRLCIYIISYKLNLRLDVAFRGVIVLKDNSVQLDRRKIVT